MKILYYLFDKIIINEKKNNTIWFNFYINNKWKFKILFDLSNIVIITENWKYVLIYFL